MLQFRQEASPDDPRAQGFVVVAELTPLECVTLAITLLQQASVKIADVQPLEEAELPLAKVPWKGGFSTKP